MTTSAFTSRLLSMNDKGAKKIVTVGFSAWNACFL